MKRYLQLGLITAVVSVVVLRVATGSFAATTVKRKSTAGKSTVQPCIAFINPQKLEKLQVKIGDVVPIQINASCFPGAKLEYVLGNFMGSNSGDINDAYNPKPNSTLLEIAPQNGVFTLNWKIKYGFDSTGKLNQPYLKAGIKNSDGTYLYPQITIGLVATVNGPSLAVCPMPKLTNPLANSILKGTSTITLTGNTGDIQYVYSFSGKNESPLYTTPSPSLNWDTTKVSDGVYGLTVWANCGSGYESTSAATAPIALQVANHTTVVVPKLPNQPPVDNNTVTYTTPDGQTVQVTPAELSNSTYRSITNLPPDTKLAINSATPKVSDQGVTGVAFTGKANPNTAYKLYVFSTTKQVDFNTDSEGNWAVTVSSSLDSGNHTAYVVLNNNRGQPVRRSGAFSFLVPTAEAAKEAAIAESVTPQADALSATKFYVGYSLLTVLVAVGVFAAFETAKRRLALRAARPTEPKPPTVVPPANPGS